MENKTYTITEKQLEKLKYFRDVCYGVPKFLKHRIEDYTAIIDDQLNRVIDTGKELEVIYRQIKEQE